MIYLLYGTDTDKARAKLRDVVESLLKKKPDASHDRMDDETWSEAKLEELLGSMGLFSAKAVIEMSNVFRNKEAKEAIVSRLKEIAESENVFVFLEGNLDKKTLEKFEKHAAKVQCFGGNERGEKTFRVGAEGRPLSKDDFNMFAMTDALGRRDRKGLWVLYQKACRLEVPAEEVHGLLAWQARAMVLASRTRSPAESGLKPFVHSKASGFSKNFSEQELVGISSKLVSLYHDSRRGLHDLGSALERFILEV